MEELNWLKGSKKLEWVGGERYSGEIKWGIDMRQREGNEAWAGAQRLIDSQG